MNNKQTLSEYVKLIVEKKLREVDVSDGSTVPYASEKHVKDLQNRITALLPWRDRSKRGTEARANYSRLIQRLKADLKSAQRHAEKHGVK